MTVPTVHTFYQSNIPSRMVEAQAQVFDHLGIPLKQWKDDKAQHCDWINTVMRDDSLGDLAVIADIDAFPLSRAGFDRLVAQAETGAVAGLAQVANHKDPTRIYAAPMFLAVKREVYSALGSPSMCRTKTGDVAQILTDRAEEAGVEVALTYPKFAILPRWPLAGYGVYGIGSFYGENDFFHLFEARRTQTQELFYAVAEGVISGQHNWQRYLEIMEQAPPPPKKKFLGLFR
ncbi:hypothetical protein [Leisingera sp. ANG-Vp]|uniref:hypothetical protein n=1 Tax=Leisingera sp. ANG-Vp TaxID=1577896 RepID=UPI00057E0930|nr:hypothetical protein [Leisingera sp. ANG-Vp]KIC21044.1 hypothetical protein RA20_06080 [Leisingera sp. ANG-Vp]